MSVDHESESRDGEDMDNDEDDVAISVKEEPRAVSLFCVRVTFERLKKIGVLCSCL